MDSVHSFKPTCYDIDLCTGIMSQGIHEKTTDYSSLAGPIELIISGCSPAMDTAVRKLVIALTQPECRPTKVTLYDCIPPEIITVLNTKTIKTYIGKDLRMTTIYFPSSVQVLEISCKNDVYINAESLGNATNLTTMKLVGVSIAALRMKRNANLTSVMLVDMRALSTIPAWFGAKGPSTYSVMNCPSIKAFNTNFWTSTLAANIILHISSNFKIPDSIEVESQPFDQFVLFGYASEKFPPSFRLLRPKSITISTPFNITMWDINENTQLESLSINAEKKTGSLLVLPRVDNLPKLRYINIRSVSVLNGFSFIGGQAAVRAAKSASKTLDGPVTLSSYEILKNKLVTGGYPIKTKIDPDILTELLLPILTDPVIKTSKSGTWEPPSAYRHQPFTFKNVMHQS